MSGLLHPISHSLIFLFFFFFISLAAQSDDYLNCPSKACNGLRISYPFWMVDDQTTTQFCGYPGFGITCTNTTQEIPTITLGDELYYVRNLTNTSISLVDYDVSPAANPNTYCPRVRHGINLDALPFNFSWVNVNLSFHFNCTGRPPGPHISPIPCLDFRDRKSFVNSISLVPESLNWDAYSCQEVVVTTVVDVFTQDVFTIPGGLGLEYNRSLINGFQLQWRMVEDCAKCEGSGGLCGHNNLTNNFMCFCSDGSSTTTGDCNKGSKIINWKVKFVIGGVSAIVSFILIFIVYCCMKSSSINCATSYKHKPEDHKHVEAFIIKYGSLTTKRYNYAEIKKMTNSFHVKLGQGGFGIVYKGKLSDGRLVAVKILNTSKASGQEFINEVASIGRTSHVNIVTLLGFCFEYNKRALVYEFMPNGSLEKFIYSTISFKTSEHIGVDKLYEVALGIARGLDYLHRGCNTRILHLDIKPHNILLDEDFCPKIADFGLAKLYSRKESVVSMLEARGTIGYIAPEVFNRNFGGVSHKSDVYSYGMLMLEMVGGRKNVDPGVGSGRTSEIYFPYYIYNRLKKDEFVLDGVTNAEENDYARKMTIVGLWCIQTDPNQRPSINEVIEMLEGSMEALEVPPKPFFSSPEQSPYTILSTSESVPDITTIGH